MHCTAFLWALCLVWRGAIGLKTSRLATLGLLLGTIWPAAGWANTAEGSLQNCWVAGLKRMALCGQVSRSLDPAQPEGQRIDINYVVVPASARQKRPDPLFFIAGGPGQSAIALIGRVQPLFARLNYFRDIVYVDQRGTGKSAPLECDTADRLTVAQGLDPEAGVARARKCLVQLQKLPYGDLRHYTTPVAMADLDAVRVALGYGQINLLGASYGTRAALEYLRQFPQAVRRMVLDGVAPPDMVLPDALPVASAAALSALFRDCSVASSCNARHPMLAQRWERLLASLPRRVEVIDPANGQLIAFTLTRDLLATLVRGPLYSPALASGLPFAIEEALAGRFTPIVGLANPAAPQGRLGIALGMHLSVVCAEDLPRSQNAPAQSLFAESIAAPYRRLCPDWPKGELPDAYYTIGPSQSPVLLLSGGLDPATPTLHGDRVTRALGAKARHLVVANAGHGLMGLGCASELIFQFLDAPTDAQALKVDAQCLSRIPRPPVFDPGRGAAIQ